MESKKSRKIVMKRIEKKSQRLVAFCKRRDGLFRKAQSLHNLSGAHIAVVVFSESGRPYVHASPSFDATVERYLTPPISSLHGIADSGGFERQNLIFPDATADPFSPSPASGVDSGEFEQQYLTSSDVIGDRPISSFPVSVDGIADSGGFERQDLIFPGGFTADPFSASPPSGFDQTLTESGELEQQYVTCSSAIGDRPTSSLPVDVDMASWFDIFEQTLADLDENGSGPISPGVVDGFTELTDLKSSDSGGLTVDTFSASPAAGVASGELEQQNLASSDAVSWIPVDDDVTWMEPICWDENELELNSDYLV